MEITLDRNGLPVGSPRTRNHYRRTLAKVAAVRALIDLGGQTKDLKVGQVLKALKAQGLKPWAELDNLYGIRFVGTSAQDSRWRIETGIEAMLDELEADAREMLATYE